MNAEPLVYSLAEVAARTPWSVKTLRALCRSGRIDCERIGHKWGLTRSQVDALLALHRRPANRPMTPEEIEAADLAEARAANRRRSRAA